MAWTYSTNYMGPAGLWWYEKNAVPYIEVTSYSELFKKEITRKVYEQYAGGIRRWCNDESDPDYSRYGDELEVPILPASEWSKLSVWCDNLVTDSLLTWEELAKRYEEETGEKLHPFYEESVGI